MFSFTLRITVIHASDTNAGNAARKLQPVLNKFSKWCLENKLSLSTTKTKQMIFRTRHKVKKANKAKDTVLKIVDTPIQIVPTYKYLGITLDSTLSLNYHVKSVVNMVAYKTVLLGKIRRYLTEEVAPKIYKIMILPYFDYGDIIYGCSGQDGLDKLQRVQNKCLKMCKGFNIRFGTKELHTVTKLEARRAAHINNFMFSRLADEGRVDRRDIRTRAHDAPLFI